jgi:hypothetical protein
LKGNRLKPHPLKSNGIQLVYVNGKRMPTVAKPCNKYNTIYDLKKNKNVAEENTISIYSA